MTDSSVSPAPLVGQALQSLRGNAPEPPAPSPVAAAPIQTQNASGPDATPAPKDQIERAPRTKHRPAAHRTPAKPPSETHAKGSATTEAKADPAQVSPPRAQVKPEPSSSEAGTDPAASTTLRQPPGGPSVSVSSALEALRNASVSAQTRLADPEDFPELPTERDLAELGPYVEHVMREAQATAVAYRIEANRETDVRVAKLVSEATASAGTVRREANAYAERTQAQADALLAERLQRIAELTARLAQMAQLAGDEAGGDQMMRDQMMQFIAGLTAAAEEAVTGVFPDTTSSES